MNQARGQQAYQRGIRAARKWSRLKNVIIKWDRLCVSKVREYRLPAWIGHVPIVIALIGSVTAMLFGGLIVAGSMLFIWAIAFILQNAGQNLSGEVTHENNSLENPKSSSGYAYESAVMNKEYDGAPYKSPSDN
ncbi:hypothetical protein FNH47_08415 [Salmonella enterica subsp. houtenae]|uniref:DUF3742 family protein n=1 Tax=Salmonella houtenae TaxID=59205 RepID=A0A5Y2SDA8_SALHO|nr:hypothetical protein [Salmonella enterica subsp. houtenae]QKT17980.1 hypothetical protein HPG84_09410 [Salmonella enterica]HAU3224621.1 hypothetical protein [Salmonella enterica subsp. houtenae]